MSIAACLQQRVRTPDAPRWTTDAAEAVMGAVLDGDADAAACGAFVMALRLRGASLDELCGFLRAAERRCLPVHSSQPVVLLPSYGDALHLPKLTPLLAMALAGEGLRVLVHGPCTDPARAGSAAVLADLGLAAARQAADIDDAWARREPAFVPTMLLCPGLQPLLDLRRSTGLRGPGHLVTRLLNPVQGAPALRLVCHTQPELGALLGAWAQREAVDAQLLRSTEGEPIADPRGMPRIDTWLAGRHRPELSLPPQPGLPAELPWLPRGGDPATTAVYVQEVLSGSRPAPAPLARQVALVKAAAERLRGRNPGL